MPKSSGGSADAVGRRLIGGKPGSEQLAAQAARIVEQQLASLAGQHLGCGCIVEAENGGAACRGNPVHRAEPPATVADAADQPRPAFEQHAGCRTSRGRDGDLRMIEGGGTLPADQSAALGADEAREHARRVGGVREVNDAGELVRRAARQPSAERHDAGSLKPQRQGCDRSLASELTAAGEDSGAGGAQPVADAGSSAQPVEHHIGHLRHRISEKDQAEVGRRRCRIELIEHALQQLRPRTAGSEDQPAHEWRQAACGMRLLCV